MTQEGGRGVQTDVRTETPGILQDLVSFWSAAHEYDSRFIFTFLRTQRFSQSHFFSIIFSRVFCAILAIRIMHFPILILSTLFGFVPYAFDFLIYFFVLLQLCASDDQTKKKRSGESLKSEIHAKMWKLKLFSDTWIEICKQKRTSRTYDDWKNEFTSNKAEYSA